MVVIPAGEFTMGSPEGEPDREEDEGPRHLVTIKEPFAAGKYEVTFAEWDACVADGGCGGYRPNDKGWGRGSRPVINISWNDAKSYVGWLSRKTGKGYRLLSEAEWEYAARAGTTTRYWCGDSSLCVSQVSWDITNARLQTQPVGSKPANQFGLHDMHGNVAEWVEDCWHSSYTGAPTDGRAWATDRVCRNHVIRGGSWGASPWKLRVAVRYGNKPDERYRDYGFRVARDF
jgi:formylglycine-generating enzyme required for sulfatase activity